MKMRYILIVLLLFEMSTVSVLSQVLDKTVAVVTLYRTENISKRRIDQQLDFLKKQPAQAYENVTERDILEATINDVLITQSAENEGITISNKQIDTIIKSQKESYGAPLTDEDFKSLMTKQTGLTWEEYREQIRKQLLQQQYVAKKYESQLKQTVTPTKAQIQSTYDDYATQFVNPAMVRAEHLFWDMRGLSPAKKEGKRKQAFAIGAKINRDSALFTKQLSKSVDDPLVEGGDLGYIIKDDQSRKALGEGFLNDIFALNKGEVSKVLESNSGYHILRITDKRAAKLLALNDPIFPGEKITVKDRIISTLQEQARRKLVLKLVEKEVGVLRKKAKIKILDKNFK